MGTWNTSITGNDTAKDLYIEYSAAFYKFDVEEALRRIDLYIREEMFDESDEYSAPPEQGVRRVRATVPVGQGQCSGR